MREVQAATHVAKAWLLQRPIGNTRNASEPATMSAAGGSLVVMGLSVAACVGEPIAGGGHAIGRPHRKNASTSDVLLANSRQSPDPAARTSVAAWRQHFKRPFCSPRTLR